MSVELPAHLAPAIDAETSETLRASLGGPLLRPGDEGYEPARTLFNAMIDRRPALIARCTAPGDVVKAVRFARAGAGRQRARRRPQRRGQRGRRRRPDDRPHSDE